MSAFYGEMPAPATPTTHKKPTLPTVQPWNSHCHVSNTWQKSDAQIMKDWPTVNQVELVTDGNGNTKIVLASRPAANEVAVIDWLTFTVSCSTFYDQVEWQLLGGDVTAVCVEKMRRVLGDVCGFDLGDKRKTGRNFYRDCYPIVNHEGVEVGDLMIGGQKDTMAVSLSGQGCTMADYGWQEGIYNFLCSAQRAKITRLDLAHDDFDGVYLSVDDLDQRETAGDFYHFGKPARVAHLGDWKYHDRENLGRTLQVGCRTSDKMMRAYEKGKQLGDKSSAWVRVEVELKAKHTLIPFDALINCSDYFVGLYPCFSELFKYEQQTQCRIEYVDRAVTIKLAKGVEILRHQFGKWLGFFRQYFADDTLAMEALAIDAGIPKRFELLKQDWDRITETAAA